MLSYLLLLPVVFCADPIKVEDGTTYITIDPENLEQFVGKVSGSDTAYTGAMMSYYSQMYSYFSGSVPFDSITATSLDPSFASALGLEDQVEATNPVDREETEDNEGDDNDDNDANDDSNDSNDNDNSNGAGVNSVAGLVYGAAAIGAGLYLL
ncbi:hypothetical protein DICA3_F24146 [Diutina catenulata]